MKIFQVTNSPFQLPIYVLYSLARMTSKTDYDNKNKFIFTLDLLSNLSAFKINRHRNKYKYKHISQIHQSMIIKL